MSQNKSEDYQREQKAALNAKVIERRYGSGKPSWGERAYIRGWLMADMEQCAAADCPYPDHRTDNGRITFARAYRRNWQYGVGAFKNWRLSEDVVEKWGLP